MIRCQICHVWFEHDAIDLHYDYSHGIRGGLEEANHLDFWNVWGNFNLAPEEPVPVHGIPENSAAGNLFTVHADDFGKAFNQIAAPTQLRPSALIVVEWAPTPIICNGCYNEESNLGFIDLDEFQAHIRKIYHDRGRVEPCFLLKKDCPRERPTVQSWLDHPVRDLVICRSKVNGFTHPLVIVLEDQSNIGEPRTYNNSTNVLFKFDIPEFDQYCFGCRNTMAENLANFHEVAAHV